MQTLQSRQRDDQRVGVTLTPLLAQEVACALRIQLARELDQPRDEPLPNREDAGRLRSALDACVDQLEMLAWGAPLGDVRMMAARTELETLAQDMLDGGNERIANPVGWNSPAEQSVRRQARQMIRAANVIKGALAADAGYEMRA